MFTEKQIEMLVAPLSREHIAERKQNNTTLSYIEGYHAIDTANKIFGFDSWSSEVIELKRLTESDVEIGFKKEAGVEVGYMATVKVIVGDQYHIDVGFGSGRSKNPKDAYELAIKEAVTDGKKRALRHWGNQFGNCLYDKQQRNIVDEDEVVTAKSKGGNPNLSLDVLVSKLKDCTDSEQLEQFRLDNKKAVNKLNEEDKEQFMKSYIELKHKLNKEAA